MKMAQNSMRLTWSGDEVDARLRQIMKSINTTCIDAAQEYGLSDNYSAGANIVSFVKVANAMLDRLSDSAYPPYITVTILCRRGACFTKLI